MPSVPSTLEAVKAQQKAVSDLCKYFESAKKPQAAALAPKHEAAKAVSAKVAKKVESLIKNVTKGKTEVVAERLSQIVTLLKERRAKLDARFLKLKTKAEAKAAAEKAAKAAKKAKKASGEKKVKKASGEKAAKKTRKPKVKDASPPKSNLFRLFGGYDLYDSDAASDANSDLLM
jgi:hypothetical protein